GRRAVARPRRRARRQERRGRAGQIVPARPEETAQIVRGKFLRPRVVDPARFRLVGVRWRTVPGAAAELELPEGDWRRADPRYVRALALHLRPPVGTDCRGFLPPHDGGARAPRRAGPALQ